MRSLHRTKLAAVVTASLAFVAACSSNPSTPATSTTSSRPSSTSSSTTASTATTTTSSTVAAPTTVPAASPYLYVYPFSSPADAESWQREANPGGHQPWHFDAGFVAMSFANGLGLPQVGQVIKVREDLTGAHVALGYHNPNGVPVTAWTIHLVRVGSGSGRPWEVVGDDQSPDFTLTTPSYGATIASPVRVSGRITGVDENIRVRVHPGAAKGPIGETCCLAAGGTRSPWSTSVAFSGTSAPVILIVASTGGHLRAVERLVFTAVRGGS